jgi:hypothetical protein
MSDTSFAINLEGLNLPKEVAERVESQLRSVVISELAKTDLAGDIAIRELPDSSERFFSRPHPVLGIVIQKLGLGGELRSFPPAANPSLLFTPPDSVKQAQALLGPGSSSAPALAGAPSHELIEAVHDRPDVKRAIAHNARVFTELLSNNPDAAQTFNELMTQSSTSSGSTERILPLVIAALGIGVAVGYLVNKK